MSEYKNHSVIDLAVIVPKVFKRWYLFVFVLPAFFIASRVYLRYQTNLYKVSSSLEIGADDGSSSDNLLNSFTPSYWSSWHAILDEITIMKSYELANETIQNGEFNIQYFSYGDIKQTELYNSAPFKVILNDKLPYVVEGVSFIVERVSDSEFALRVDETSLVVKNMVNDSVVDKCDNHLNGVYKFGQEIFFLDSVGFKLDVLDPKWINRDGVGYKFFMKTNNTLVYDFSSALKVKSEFDESSIMNLSMAHATPRKAIDFLNGLMQSYKRRDYNKKLSSLSKSLEFLKNQIKETQSKLNDKELIAQKLKDDTKIYDLDAAADKTYEQILNLQEEKERYALQQNYYKLVMDYIKEHRDFSDLVAPSLMGIDDPMVASIVESLKEVYVEKAQKEFSVTQDNPTYATLSLGQQKTIDIALENLDQGIERIDFNVKSINKQMDEKFELLKSLPSAELNFLRVKREIDGLNKLLEFLVEREAVLGISAAKVASNHRVVEKARLTSLLPISPKRSLIQLVFVIIGFLVCAVIVFFLEFFNQKVTTEAEVEKINGEKVLSSLPFVKNDNNIIPFENPKSYFTESLRTLKHNLSFIITKKSSANILGFTSSISGEGKTFIAANLGGILARSGKKTLLIGADLRKPKLNDYLHDLKKIGLSEFLVGTAGVDEVIQTTTEENFDVILSGDIPPNPAEILENELFDQLFDCIRDKYDYILLDCPPVGLVSDYRVIEKKLDATIFVVKQDYTTLKNLNRYHDYKMTHSHIVFNGVKQNLLNKYGYGYGYGYGQGYYQEDK